LAERLYTHLVPTLGPRAIPALVLRLRQVLDQPSGDGWLDRKIVRAITAIDSPEVPRIAVQLLGDPQARVQRAGARILCRRPTAEALDSLWSVHCSRERDPAPFLAAGEYASFAYEDTFDALRACVLLNSDWLEHAISNASHPDPIWDLAYLLAAVNDRPLWGRVKRILLDKVDARHQRSLALCIEAYRDVEELPWLKAHVGGGTDLVGPAAVRALALLDPTVALASLDQLPQTDLYATRNWHLGPLFLAHPQQTQAHLLERLRATDSPWTLGSALQGSENAIGVPALSVLLDSFESLLAAEAASPMPQKERFFRELTFLNEIWAPDLLAEIGRRRNTGLEERLAAWLRVIGPQQGGWREHTKQEALQLLAKLGGEGFTATVNEWLRIGDRGAHFDAFSFAPRSPDSTTLERLNAIAELEETDENRAEPGHAAAALAGCGAWKAVVAYIVRAGLKTLTVVTDFRGDVPALDDATMTPALAKLPAAGALLAVAFSGRTDLISYARETLAMASPGSDEALAAIAGVTWLKDHEASTAPLLARFLGPGVHGDRAVNALFENGTREAHEALAAYVRRSYDHDVAIGLLAAGRDVEYLTPLIEAHVLSAHDIEKLEKLQDVARRRAAAPVGALLQKLLTHPELIGYLRTHATAEEAKVAWSPGRAAAVQLLALVEPATAYAAALAALDSSSERGRHRFPERLVTIDPRRATGALLARAPNERNVRVVFAMARAVAAHDVDMRLVEFLGSRDPAKAEAAALMAERMPHSRVIEDALVQTVETAPVAVRDAVLRGLALQRAAKAAEELRELLTAEQDTAYRWVLLDAFIAVADPGDPDTGWPPLAMSVSNTLTRGMFRYFRDQVRKNAREASDKADRRQRVD
jgi:hypothetical protein